MLQIQSDVHNASRAGRNRQATVGKRVQRGAGPTSSLDDVLAEYMMQADSGQAIDRGAFIRRHDQFASELRSFFSATDLMANMSRQLSDTAAGSTVVGPDLNKTNQPVCPVDADGETVPFCEGSTYASNGKPRAETIGRYHVCEAIGGGSFGRVYRCYDDLAHRDVAIKVPEGGNENWVARADEFLHEARSTARLRHPNIVTVLDVGRDSRGQVFIVYEYVPGKTLKHRIERRDFKRDEAIEWAAQIADALHHAHKHGVVHRDIKPANILFDQEQRPRLADFGLAKRDDRFFREDKGRILGTCAYMNPEQAARKSHWASPQSDIYSLGVVLYELLCRRLPFQAKSTAELLQEIRERTPPMPRSIDDTIPKAVEDVCLKAMAKDPAARYRTAADMARDLRRAVRPTTSRSVRWATLLSLIVTASSVISVALIKFAGTEPPVKTPAASPGAARDANPANPLPRLDVHLQRRDQAGDYQRLTDEEFPLRVGDRLQLHANLANHNAAYVYLYWIECDGTVKRFYPANPSDLPPAESDRDILVQEKVTDVWSPAAAEGGPEAQWWPITSADGTETIFVAASSQPVSTQELYRFESTKFVLARDHFGAGRLVEFSSGKQRHTSPTRSVGSRPVAAPKSGQPGLSRLQAELDAHFDAYCGFVLRHESIGVLPRNNTTKSPMTSAEVGAPPR